MKIIIQNRSNQPLYQQIKDQIKQAIMTNALEEGERLPTIRALANDLHVSVLTTKKAYAELEAEGFITTRVGKGSYVAPENLELLIESKRKMVEGKLLAACRMARQLGIEKSALHEMLDLLFEEEDER
ncbi:GntR family transcriptional regulator [Sporolactobacillus terrae]|uniref:GntR family transcriptional regulator n=1 Tax=Sporolactobacillus terrae TaxID=269673 RepID=UPI00111A1B8F|nr:GntR family transcriptional regulator [Sporolactobacillus terrae]